MMKTLPCLKAKGPEAMPNFAVLSWQRRRQYTNEIKLGREGKNHTEPINESNKTAKVEFPCQSRYDKNTSANRPLVPFTH